MILLNLPSNSSTILDQDQVHRRRKSSRIDDDDAISYNIDVIKEPTNQASCRRRRRKSIKENVIETVRMPSSTSPSPLPRAASSHSSNPQPQIENCQVDDITTVNNFTTINNSNNNNITNEKCLICRNNECVGNLYCPMHPSNDNDRSPTLSTIKSIIQNRRKSSLRSFDADSILTKETSSCSASPLWLQSNVECPLRFRSNSFDSNNATSRESANSFEDNENRQRCNANSLNCSCSQCCCSSSNSRSNSSSSFRSTVSKVLSEKPIRTSATISKRTNRSCGSDGDGDGRDCRFDDGAGSHADIIGISSTMSSAKRPKKFCRCRSFTNSFLNYILWFLVSILSLNFSISLLVSGEFETGMIPYASNRSELSAGRVCNSIDIRNKPSEFINLTGCRVIEGFLVITLLDVYASSDYENYSFPLLTEITDYLMLYRVNGLTTLEKLFPNLKVIRGNTLFEGFALVLYENSFMEEIGLKSLTNINRGGVRIEKNLILCFVHTVDWNRIATNASTETLIFKRNKPTNECPSCTGSSVKLKTDSTSPDCSVMGGSRRFCWNQKNCQKICPIECGNRACNDQGKCCDSSCLGSCSGPNLNICSVCRHLTIGDGPDQICTQTCPSHLYKHMNRRCITRGECLETAKPLRSNNEKNPYVPFQGSCLLSCNPGYERSRDTCVPCESVCAKQCESKSIYSLSEAESLRGCTNITGDLMISIRQGGPHLIDDLESALSSIEEINGSLKITRSYSIVSLSFLKSLKVIHGNGLDESNYALYVLDNQNLQNLWGENQNVTIAKGRVFFHFNPKLCYNKIEKLIPWISNMTNSTFDSAEVATDSNGDRVACDISVLNVTIKNLAEKAAIIEVVPIKFEDERVFLGYQFFYMESPFQNVSIYENRHGCGYDAWTVEDDNSKDLFHIFTHLKPYTQYAYYVKTYTIASEKKGGQSPIQYFRTLPDLPDPVRNLEAVVIDYSSIEIKWSEPREPNGNLTEYHFSANISLDNGSILEQRNYCTEPIKISNYHEHPITEQTKKPVIANEESCKSVCKEIERHANKVHLEESPERENEIEFEDALQNFVYVKRKTEEQRQRRAIRSTESSKVQLLPKIGPAEAEPPKEVLKKIKENGYYTVYGDKVNATTKSFIFKNLKHFSTYKIFVIACREGTGRNCSIETQVFPRTAKKDGADDIQNLTVRIENVNNTRNNVRLIWSEPVSPNGVIVSYSIKYYRVDVEHAKPFDKCITNREYKNSTKGYVLYGMETGNYSVQVMATSLAGDGNYSASVYFYIQESRMSWQVITLISVGCFICGIIIIYLIWYVRRRCMPAPDDLKLFTSVNPEYISMQYTPDEWEIPRDKIIQLRELGQGSFGMVYEGLVKNLNKIEEDTPCAIKTVNENATDRERINFLNEASVMKAFDTYHVVRLLGVVSRDQPTLVIMELMTNGDLKGYLRLNRPDSDQAKAGDVQVQPPTLKRILQMAIEIADGMAYLSAKKFVHRDLAARNCMVAEDLTVKIGDFGMTRDIYETDYYRKGTKGLLPVRWMAPESLKDGVFSSSSDVFSYGVVLWEMATLASQPYQGLSNDQVLRYVIDGGVMERPENCPDKLYNLMRRCWQHRPSARPSFIAIIEHLLDDADRAFREVSFFHSDHGQEVYKHMQIVSDIDDRTPLRVEDDDFKVDVGENFLMDRTDSHLVPDEQQHSPYSLGSGIIISSTPDGTSKRSNQNSPSNKNKNSATTTTATVQSLSNSLVPPRFRRIWRNAFLGNGNNSYSNRSCNGAGGGGGFGMGIGAGGGGGGGSTSGNDGGGASSSSGIGGIFSGLTGFGGNNGNTAGGSVSSTRPGDNNRRYENTKDSSKDYQKWNQDTSTNPLLNDLSICEISPPRSLPLNIQQTQKQCNHNDYKVKNSNLSSSNSFNQRSASPYHQQIKQPRDGKIQLGNGYIATGNPSSQQKQPPPPLSIPQQHQNHSPHHNQLPPPIIRPTSFKSDIEEDELLLPQSPPLNQRLIDDGSKKPPITFVQQQQQQKQPEQLSQIDIRKRGSFANRNDEQDRDRNSTSVADDNLVDRRRQNTAAIKNLNVEFKTSC